MLSDLFLNLGCLADSVTKIIELRSADTAVSDSFNLDNVGGMDGKYSFHADTVRNTANGKGFGNAGTFAGDNSSLENLDSLFFAFTNLDVNLDGIADLDYGSVLLE